MKEEDFHYMNKLFTINVATAAALCVFASACAKKQVAVATPPAPAPAVTKPAPAPVQAAATPRPAPAQQVAQATPSRYPDAKTRARIDELLGHIQDAYFDYNKHTLNDTAVKALNADATELAAIMKQFPDYKLRVEGYCDERGSAEYNLALGQARADAAKGYLVSMGVSTDQLSTISYGKEKQTCTEEEESCWSKNRRIHMTALATN
jgi:peptidoglycan-associated lipoprotein